MKNRRRGLVRIISRLNPYKIAAKSPLTDAEAAEIVKALRRGVRASQVAKAIGMIQSTIYSRLGSWTIHRCRCFGKIQEPK